MKTMFLALVAAVALVATGGAASAQHCAAPAQVQQVVAAPAIVVAQPQLFVVPGAPTVALQQFAAPAVVVAQPLVVQQQVVRQRAVQQVVVQRAPVARQRSLTITRSVIR